MYIYMYIYMYIDVYIARTRTERQRDRHTQTHTSTHTHTHTHTHRGRHLLLPGNPITPAREAVPLLQLHQPPPLPLLPRRSLQGVLVIFNPLLIACVFFVFCLAPRIPPARLIPRALPEETGRLGRCVFCGKDEGAWHQVLGRRLGYQRLW